MWTKGDITSLDGTVVKPLDIRQVDTGWEIPATRRLTSFVGLWSHGRHVWNLSVYGHVNMFPLLPLMVRWVVRSILHGVDPLSYFSFQPVLHDWCNKGHGMCYPVCGMVDMKEPLLLIGKSSPCGSSGFPLSLSEWSFTICLTPYNRKIKCVESIVK